MSLYDTALQFAEKKEWLLAVSCLEQLLLEKQIKEEQQLAYYYYQQAFFYNEANKYECSILKLDQAYKYYQLAYDIVNSILTLVFKAKLFLQLREPSKAIFYLKKAETFLTKDRVDLQVYILEMLAISWYDLYDFAQALICWETALPLVKDEGKQQEYRRYIVKIKQILFL